MMKEMQLLSKEKTLNEEKINKCPVCGVNGRDGALCTLHAEMTKNYKWLKDYINGQEKIDSRIIYILEYAISDRKSLIINDIEIVDGRLRLKEYLDNRMEKRKCSLWLERILKEIILIERGKSLALQMIKEDMIVCK